MLLEEAVSIAVANRLPVNNRGTAFFDPERDALLTSSTSFDTARQTLINIPNFTDRLGTEAATRILLQFAYQYFKRVDTVEYQEAVFEVLWCDFIAEIQDAYWVVRGVANVRNFDSESHLIDLGDGITIRGRSSTDLASLGFDAEVWARIAEDWRGPRASSFVLVADSESKQTT